MCLFKKKQVKLTLPDIPIWEADWNNPEYRTIQDFMYDKNSYTDSSCVEVKPYGLHLKVLNLETPEYREHWSGNHNVYYKIGWVEFHDIFDCYGTWVFRFSTPIKPAFPAIWFLREAHPANDYFECEIITIEGNRVELLEIPNRTPGINQWLTEIDGGIIGRITNYSSGIIYLDRIPSNISLRKVCIHADSIQPEIDLMEIWGKNRTWFGYAIHWGSTFDKYDVHSVGKDVCKAEPNKEYEFAVRMTSEKYEFFLGGIKTWETSKGLSDKPLYLVINSGVLEGITALVNVPDVIIKSIKYYKL
jgi:hypothetical protein